MNNWIVFTIFAGLSSSVFNYVNRYVLKLNGDSTSFAWWFELLRAVIFLFALPFDYFIIWSVKTVSFLLLLGVIELFSVYFYMKMHQFSHVSVSTIVLRLRLVWIPLLAFLFVGERLSYVNYMGIFTIFFGLSLVTTPKEFFYDKGIKLAFLCSFITAVLAVIVKIISPYVSASIIVLAMSIPPVFLFPFFVKDWKKRTKDFYSKNITGVTTAVVANALSMYFQVQSLKIGNVSQVQGVFQAVSLTTVLAGIFLLGEKEKIWQKLIGSAIVLVGVYLLI